MSALHGAGYCTTTPMCDGCRLRRVAKAKAQARRDALRSGLVPAAPYTEALGAVFRSGQASIHQMAKRVGLSWHLMDAVVMGERQHVTARTASRLDVLRDVYPVSSSDLHDPERAEYHSGRWLNAQGEVSPPSHTASTSSSSSSSQPSPLEG